MRDRLVVPDPQISDRRHLLVAGWGIVIVLIFATVAFHSPLARQIPIHHTFRWVVILGLGASYLTGLRGLSQQPDERVRRDVFRFAAIFALFSFFVPPIYSTDIYSNINIGWTWQGHGLSPYIHSLVEVPNWESDEMFRPDTTWLFTPCAYGFAFVHIAGALCWLGRGDWGVTVLLFKLTSAAVYLAMGGVVSKICRRLRWANPDRAVYHVLWNPLILLHGLIDAHNDLWLALPLILALHLALQGGWRLPWTLLTISILIKYISVVLVPFLAIYLIRRVGWLRTLAGIIPAMIVAGLLAEPFLWQDCQRIPWTRHLQNASGITNSVPSMVVFLFEFAGKPYPELLNHMPRVISFVKLLFTLGFLVFAGIRIWRRLRETAYPSQDLARDCVALMFALICWSSAKFFPWYMGMVLPLALILPESDRWRRVVMAVTFAQLLAITFIGQTHFLNAYLMTVLPTYWVAGYRLRVPARWGHREFVQRAVRMGFVRLGS